MDKLKSLHYLLSKSDNRSNILTRYTWTFYDSNNILNSLQYQHSIYYINTLNKKTMIRENTQHISERYILSSFEQKSINEQINDIDEWLTNNFEYLKKSNDNFMKSFDIIKYITSELGEYNYAFTYEVGWSIKDVYKLYIDLYSTKIVVNYKGKDAQLSEQKLKTFIQKNKSVIIKAKENDHKKYIQRRNEAREKQRLDQLTKDTEQLHLTSTLAQDITHKDKCESFYIKKSLKERYKIQACKPLSIEYPWHTKLTK